MLISENEILQLLSQKLKPKRLEHSVNVAKRAEYLAELYQYDKRIAKMTGLLHDVCKNDNFDIMFFLFFFHFNLLLIIIQNRNSKNFLFFNKGAGTAFCGCAVTE